MKTKRYLIVAALILLSIIVLRQSTFPPKEAFFLDQDGLFHEHTEGAALCWCKGDSPTPYKENEK